MKNFIIFLFSFCIYFNNFAQVLDDINTPTEVTSCVQDCFIESNHRLSISINNFNFLYPSVNHFGFKIHHTNLSNFDVDHSFYSDVMVNFSNTDGLDYILPNQSIQIKEAYFKKQYDLNSSLIEVGYKIIKPNIGLFYSPTDFFAQGSFPFATSPDPLNLIDDRVGNLLFNYEMFFDNGKFSFTYIPKLIHNSSNNEIDYFGFNLAVTNSINKYLLAFSNNLGDYGYMNAFLYNDDTSKVKYGVNGSLFLGGSHTLFYDAILVNHNAIHLNNLIPSDDVLYNFKSSIGATSTFYNGSTMLLEYSYNPYSFSKKTWRKILESNSDKVIKSLILSEIYNNDLPSENILSANLNIFNCFNFFSSCNYSVRYDFVSEGSMAKAGMSKVFNAYEVNFSFLFPFGKSRDNLFSKLYSKYSFFLSLTHHF